MSRPHGLSPLKVSLARKVLVADTLNTDVALPASATAADGGMVAANSFQTVWLGLECEGGTAPTATVSPRVRDADAPDGSRWKDLSIGGSAQSVVLTNNGPFKEVRVDGREWIAVVTGLTGTPDSASILMFPGALLPGARGLAG
jgi:hypothetical protein